MSGKRRTLPSMTTPRRADPLLLLVADDGMTEIPPFDELDEDPVEVAADDGPGRPGRGEDLRVGRVERRHIGEIGQVRSDLDDVVD